MELTASDLWSRILQTVQTRLPEHTFRAWLSSLTPVALSNEDLLIETPSPFHTQWVEDKYGALLREGARLALGRPIHISFTSPDTIPMPELPAVEVSSSLSTAPRQGLPGPGEAPPGPGLNQRYTFQRFVVGGDNELAAAASVAVAEQPARMYNPLFLYGGVGLGKTHLMHAIGNAILRTHPGRRVAYVPSEQFTNELVTSIQEGKMPQFRRRYRMMDLLLVDDVHFLEGKERTQEEFFHTFNALYDAQRQIVLTSDRPPKDIPGLEERLMSRFEWGLVADIKAPDYETRVAILRKKAADDHLTLDHEVMDFIARSCTSSVRELEGAVIKLLAYSSLKHQDITVAMAEAALKETLRDLGAKPKRELSGRDIQEAVARRWGVDPAGLRSKRRTRDLMIPRQVAMYLMRELMDLPLTQIGSQFGGRDHSTVIHSIKKVEEGIEVDDTLAARVAELRGELSEEM